MKWRVSAKWSTKRIDCTPRGILFSCHAKCCRAPFWPGRAGENKVYCDFLGNKGCTLTVEQRPIVCNLFPFTVSKENLIRLSGTSIAKHQCCNPCYGAGPMIIDALNDNFEHMFGKEQTRVIIETVKSGKDAIIDVPDSIYHDWLREEEQAEKDVLPTPRGHK